MEPIPPRPTITTRPRRRRDVSRILPAPFLSARDPRPFGARRFPFFRFFLFQLVFAFPPPSFVLLLIVVNPVDIDGFFPCPRHSPKGLDSRALKDVLWRKR